jgi:hypothetical protein
MLIVNGRISLWERVRHRRHIVGSRYSAEQVIAAMDQAGGEER